MSFAGFEPGLWRYRLHLRLFSSHVSPPLPDTHTDSYSTTHLINIKSPCVTVTHNYLYKLHIHFLYILSFYIWLYYMSYLSYVDCLLCNYMFCTNLPTKNSWLMQTFLAIKLILILTGFSFNNHIQLWMTLTVLVFKRKLNKDVKAVLGSNTIIKLYFNDRRTTETERQRQTTETDRQKDSNYTLFLHSSRVIPEAGQYHRPFSWVCPVTLFLAWPHPLQV